MADRFLERLSGGPPITCDGGMGALITAAVQGLRCPEEANLRAPETVLDFHLGYSRAGAELIETNSFGANRRKLRTQFLEDELAAINEAAVKLAREAREVSGKEVLVAGSIGPLGDVVDAEEERGTFFAEQAALLEGRGVDLFMVETFFDLDELVTAVEAVRSVSSLPVVALLTFDEDAETLGGVTAREAAERLAPLALAAIGANHGAGVPARLEPRVDARRRPHDQGVGPRRLRRHQRQPDGAGADERADVGGRDRARDRDRDDPTRHTARHDDHGPPVDAARRARRRRPERPLGDRRPARGRRLTRLARRLRRRSDRHRHGR